MSTSDRFLRFAAECEVMAEFSPSPENEAVWRQLAERWRKIADLFERQDSLAHTAGPMRRHRQPAHSWVH